MSMTKKDFIALADAVREHQHFAANPANDLVPFDSDHLDTIATFCKSQNSAFMREKWLRYIVSDNGKNWDSMLANLRLERNGK